MRLKKKISESIQIKTFLSMLALLIVSLRPYLWVGHVLFAEELPCRTAKPGHSRFLRTGRDHRAKWLGVKYKFNPGICLKKQRFCHGY